MCVCTLLLYCGCTCTLHTYTCGYVYMHVPACVYAQAIFKMEDMKGALREVALEVASEAVVRGGLFGGELHNVHVHAHRVHVRMHVHVCMCMCMCMCICMCMCMCMRFRLDAYGCRRVWLGMPSVATAASPPPPASPSMLYALPEATPPPAAPPRPVAPQQPEVLWSRASSVRARRARWAWTRLRLTTSGRR